MLFAVEGGSKAEELSSNNKDEFAPKISSSPNNAGADCTFFVSDFANLIGVFFGVASCFCAFSHVLVSFC